jgi:hypothetical protein
VRGQLVGLPALEHETFKRHFSFAEWAFPQCPDKTHFVN